MISTSVTQSFVQNQSDFGRLKAAKRYIDKQVMQAQKKLNVLQCEEKKYQHVIENHQNKIVMLSDIDRFRQQTKRDIEKTHQKLNLDNLQKSEHAKKQKIVMIQNKQESLQKSYDKHQQLIKIRTKDRIKNDSTSQKFFISQLQFNRSQVNQTKQIKFESNENIRYFWETRLNKFQTQRNLKSVELEKHIATQEEKLNKMELEKEENMQRLQEAQKIKSHLNDVMKNTLMRSSRAQNFSQNFHMQQQQYSY